ncbi:hypothetical protein Tsubulata_002072 [Turnera subulata]|uniref:TFIIS central domain-containing protein n=1 Tax=Turnera subulata TaxID=218843 RepID=A0A9Q0G1T4_9ROSI|nr:hypothetical protein Tsubulata_035934 [Turnera subulata]KAJ4841677.1 hypothetical protein Tsubulata_002072 [Turnera subulata]
MVGKKKVVAKALVEEQLGSPAEKAAVREVLELLKTAQKAAAGKTAAEEKRCLDALSQLRSLPIRVETLVSANAGKLLRPLRNHAQTKIGDLASNLYESWAKRVAAVARKRTQLQEPGKKPATTTSSATLMSQDDGKREMIREKLYQGLCMVSEETEEGDIMKEVVDASDPAGVAARVEAVLSENWGRLDNWKYRSLCFNIKDPRNPDFRRKVLLGQVGAEMIVGLMRGKRSEMASTSGEMASNELQAALERFEKISERQRLINGDAHLQEATTDQFKCGKCGKRETTYYQLQTRSADEPMTSYITCVSCRNRWKC